MDLPGNVEIAIRVERKPQLMVLFGAWGGLGLGLLIYRRERVTTYASSGLVECKVQGATPVV